MTRVLLLEDDQELASIIADALELKGIGVARFASLHEARAAIPPVGFNVLLCDYDLPDGTGLDFLADVQRLSAVGLAPWKTILCSGLDRRRELEASGLTIDAVLSKTDLPEVIQLILET